MPTASPSVLPVCRIRSQQFFGRNCSDPRADPRPGDVRGTRGPRSGRSWAVSPLGKMSDRRPEKSPDRSRWTPSVGTGPVEEWRRAGCGASLQPYVGSLGPRQCRYPARPGFRSVRNIPHSLTWSCRGSAARWLTRPASWLNIGRIPEAALSARIRDLSGGVGAGPKVARQGLAPRRDCLPSDGGQRKRDSIRESRWFGRKTSE